MEDEEGFKLSKGAVNLLRDLAVAFLLVAIVMASLFAFTRVWPPMVVVESDSMQHSNTESFLGVIDTGDIVLVQDAPRRQDIITYVEGRARDPPYSTYGDYGDVIIFRKFGREDLTPVIHRAIMFVEWNETTQGFDIPSLLALERGEEWVASKPEPFGLGRNDWVVLKDVTYRHSDIRFTFNLFANLVGEEGCPSPCRGFITMGDNNAAGGGGYDWLWIVREEWVLGRARGEIPWFGLLKLVLSGGFAWGDSRAPPNSWSSLTVAIILLVVGPLALDIVVSVVASWRERPG
jgi:signal peptidase